jgi:hypothetical protein
MRVGAERNCQRQRFIDLAVRSEICALKAVTWTAFACYGAHSRPRSDGPRDDGGIE